MTTRSGVATLSAVVAGVLAIGFAGSAVAQTTGLEGLHDKVRVGRKICFSDHFHDGSGSGPSLKVAQSAAIRSWESFTGWEYGASWGSFRLSESKKMTCSRASAGGFDCQVTSRPCRR